ncbi:MAG: N-acetylglucosamine kinase [Prochlorococcaceae cyanobacterium]
MADPPGGLIAGFDAGQTHTTCRLAPADGMLHNDGWVVLAEGEGSGICHLAAPAGPQRFDDALRSSLAAARAALPSAWADRPLQAAAVGASGIEQGTATQDRGRQLAARALELPLERLTVCGDERTALRGAFGRAAGIVVISGTGAIAVGRDAAGVVHRCGGWGWLLDGAGSAMDIGRDGLALSLRMADRRLPVTPLLADLWQALGVDPADPGGPQQIKAMVVDPAFGPAGFARLAPLVARWAAAGDPACGAILAASSGALAAMVATVARELALVAPVPVCAMGGAVEHLPGLAAEFWRQLGPLLPGVRPQVPAGDACQGGLELAREQLLGAPP